MIDKPLVPVLLRMEQAGVRIDSAVLGEMSNRLAVDIDNLAERIYKRLEAMGSIGTGSISTPRNSLAMCSSTRCCCPSR